MGTSFFRSGFKTSDQVQGPRKIWCAGLPVEPVEPVQNGTKSFLFFHPANGQRANRLNLLVREYFNLRDKAAIGP
jgi:hypothetical protein